MVAWENICICGILFILCLLCLLKTYSYEKSLEAFGALRNVVVTDDSGNLTTVNAETSMMYCDGTTCTQPYKSTLKVGAWTIEEDATGNLIFRRNGAANEEDKPYIMYSTDGNIWTNRSTFRGWLPDNLQALQNSSVQYGENVWFNNLKDSGNAYISRQDDNVFKASPNKDYWEKFRIEK